MINVSYPHFLHNCYKLKLFTNANDFRDSLAQWIFWSRMTSTIKVPGEAVLHEYLNAWNRLSAGAPRPQTPRAYSVPMHDSLGGTWGEACWPLPKNSMPASQPMDHRRSWECPPQFHDWIRQHAWHYAVLHSILGCSYIQHMRMCVKPIVVFYWRSTSASKLLSCHYICIVNVCCRCKLWWFGFGGIWLLSHALFVDGEISVVGLERLIVTNVQKCMRREHCACMYYVAWRLLKSKVCTACFTGPTSVRLSVHPSVCPPVYLCLSVSLRSSVLDGSAQQERETL